MDCDEREENPRLMSGQSFSSTCRDRRHRPRTRSTHFRRRTIRRIATTMMSIGNDNWRCKLRGVILKSDFHDIATPDNYLQTIRPIHFQATPSGFQSFLQHRDSVPGGMSESESAIGLPTFAANRVHAAVAVHPYSPARRREQLGDDRT